MAALVGYSDSEASDSDSPNIAPTTTTTTTAAAKSAAPRAKGAFQKLVDPSAPRKIKVDLPTVKPEVENEDEARPAKKPRMGGDLRGFNSSLPAPNRSGDAAKKPGLGKGVNLKTGAEPAFSRERVEPDLPVASPAPAPAQDDTNHASQDVPTSQSAPAPDEAPRQVKPVGNAMKFKPLSVVRKNKPKKKVLPTASPAADSPTTQSSANAAKQPPPPKPKVSLFSVSHEEEVSTPATALADYQPFLAEPQATEHVSEADVFSHAPAPLYTNPNSLGAVADDLNLSASARRQLFGRNKDAAAAASIMHFNTDEEYNRNEQIRAQGEAVEHRVVKAVAPGKHSLKQLVSAASTQKDALEDAWAEGKRNKAEGGSRYGW